MSLTFQELPFACLFSVSGMQQLPTKNPAMQKGVKVAENHIFCSA